MISYRRAASGPPQMLTVVEQHEPGPVITDIRMPPTGRDGGTQAAACLQPGR
jgi:CheY-like chemotaxis protein